MLGPSGAADAGSGPDHRVVQNSSSAGSGRILSNGGLFWLNAGIAKGGGR